VDWKAVEAWMVVLGVAAEGVLSPAPIKCVLFGKIHVPGITMGVEAVVAGNRIVEGGGLEIPDHGLGIVLVQVRLVFPEFRPRASMTAPVEDTTPLEGVKIKFSAEQSVVLVPANVAASMKAPELVQQRPGLPLVL
jgi:hypothetical protein